MDLNQNAAKESASLNTWNWKDIIIIVAGTAAIFLFLLLIWAFVVSLANIPIDQITKPTIAQSLGLVTLEAVALIGGVYFLGIKRRGYTWDAVGLRRPSWNWLILTTGVTLISIPIVSVITLLVVLVFDQPLENPQLDFLMPEDLSAANALLMLILTGFVTPFGEELLFRGVFYTWLRQKWAILPSILLSSFIFGLMHGNLAVGITGFLIGVVAALVFEFSNSLWTSIIVHTINNSAKIALLYILLLFGESLGIQ